jgi:hypothetical protein
VSHVSGVQLFLAPFCLWSAFQFSHASALHSRHMCLMIAPASVHLGLVHSLPLSLISCSGLWCCLAGSSICALLPCLFSLLCSLALGPLCWFGRSIWLLNSSSLSLGLLAFPWETASAILSVAHSLSPSLVRSSLLVLLPVSLSMMSSQAILYWYIWCWLMLTPHSVPVLLSTKCFPGCLLVAA